MPAAYRLFAVLAAPGRGQTTLQNNMTAYQNPADHLHSRCQYIGYHDDNGKDGPHQTNRSHDVSDH